MKVEMSAGERQKVRFGVRGGPCCAVSDPRLHAGLGHAARSDLTVTRARGGTTVPRDTATDAVVRVPRPR